MNDDLFISGTEANELRHKVSLREGVIRILESDIHGVEEQRNRLFFILLEVCRGERGDRCGILENCEHCSIREVLEQISPEVCVTKNAESDTQNSLCFTDDTQKISVWHPVKETPLDDRKIVVLKHADFDDRCMVMSSFWVTNSKRWKATADVLKVEKWAYQEKLEGL